MNIDVENYTLDELTELLELPDTYTLQEAIQRSSEYMAKYKNSHPELSKFFLQVRQRFIQAMDEENSSSDSDDAESIHENEELDDPNTTQANNNQHYDIEHPTHPHLTTPSSSSVQQVYPTSIMPNTLNPLYRKTYKRMVVIDSKYRENYFQSNVNDFHVTFPEPIKNVVKMTVSNVDIINTHYTVNANEGTNFMRIKLINKADVFNPYEIPITLEPGNMFSEDMTQKINDQIRLYFANKDKNTKTLFPDDAITNPLATDQIVKCEVSTLSGRSVFTLNSDFSGNDSTINFEELQLDFTNPHGEEMPPFLSLGWIMGFRNRLYTGANTYKSESIFNAAGRQVVYLSIDDYQNHKNDRISILHQDAFFSKDLIARVPLRDGKFVITFSDLSDQIERTREYYGPVDIQRLHVQLYDEYGLPFDNNNMDYNIVLEFEILY